MATSGSREDNETEIPIDVSGFIRAFTPDDNEDEESGGNNEGAKTGDISMFCKACLHPYCGEQKAGTIVLRCERCGQTDTVLEERIESINPQEWIGNLMMNRFMQAVKEQTNLSANLMDPHFADDDYQSISLTLSEYTFNIEKITAQMFDIAKRTNVATDEDMARIEACNENDPSLVCLEEVRAMNATKTLIEIHKILVISEPNQDTNDSALDNNAEEGSVCKINHIEQMKGGDTEEDLTGVVKDHGIVDTEQDLSCNTNTGADSTHRDLTKADVTTSADVMGEEAKLLQLIRERLNHLGPTIMGLIETLIVKYNLPGDIMEAIEERLKLDKKTENAKCFEARSGGELEGKAACTEQENDQENGEELGNEDNSVNGETETVDENNSDDNESRVIFNIPTQTIKNEVFSTLGHKLKLRFVEAENAPVTFSQDHTIAFCSDLTGLQIIQPENKKDDDVNKETSTGLEVQTEETTNSNETHKAKEGVEVGNDGGETNKTSLMVNFYSLSSEFIRELQRRKSKALGERKDKALANIHDKIQRLKKEMERVEEAVTEELALAYERKMKKVERQRKQLDETRGQVKEVERLLEYYARTGQHEKVQELIEKFNIHYEN